VPHPTTLMKLTTRCGRLRWLGRILQQPTIRDRHAEVAAVASRQQASYKGFLVGLLSIECDDREQRRKARLVREAAFPPPNGWKISTMRPTPTCPPR
jgi:hypothetical protein